MGNSNPRSKLCNALSQGNTSAVLDLWKDPKFRAASLLNEPFESKTMYPIQMACKNAMEKVVVAFLKHGADPNLKDKSTGQNALHTLCSYRTRRPNRLKCLKALLKTSKFCLRLNAIDGKGNTLLHKAAGNGLIDVVTELLERHVVTTITNNAGRTAAEEASYCGFQECGHLIEAHILYDTSDDIMLSQFHGESPDVGDLARRVMSPPSTNFYSILAQAEVRSVKDTILIRISQALSVDLGIAEAVLHKFKWDDTSVLDQHRNGMLDMEALLPAQTLRTVLSTESESKCQPTEECLICGETGVQVNASSLNHGLLHGKRDSLESILICSGACEHSFCLACWRQYLGLKVKNAETQSLCCPAHADGCQVLLPANYLVYFLDHEDTQQHLQRDIDDFVISHSSLDWCPQATCSRAVMLKSPPAWRSIGVTCDCGHNFCFSCKLPPHDPVPCNLLDVFFSHVKALTGKEPSNIDHSGRSVADSLWINANTKPCPKCKSAILKGDGCHHVTCSNCKHEWCWLCGDDWSKHTKKTGGYYSCNRFKPSVRDSDVNPGLAAQKSNSRSDAGVKNTDSHAAIRRRGLAMDKFLHYYSRFEAHMNSMQLESPYKESMHKRLKHLRKACEGKELDPFSKTFDFSWIFKALDELYLARSALAYSYVYGLFQYGGASKEIVGGSSGDPFSKAFRVGEQFNKIGFLTDDAKRTMYMLDVIMKASTKKGVGKSASSEQQLFEMQQADLEVATEELSAILCRPHIRVTRERLLKKALHVRQERSTFLLACARGLCEIPIDEIPTSHDKSPSQGRRKSRSRRRRPGQRSGRQSDVVWQCPICTVLNQRTSICDVCGYEHEFENKSATNTGNASSSLQRQSLQDPAPPAPSSGVFSNLLPLPVTASTPMESSTPGWTCGICTSFNDSSASMVCNACGLNAQDENSAILQAMLLASMSSSTSVRALN